MKHVSLSFARILLRPTRCRWTQWRTQKFSWREFIQWHMVVICIWCALFVKSQYKRHMFPNQRFGEVCWHNMHILLHALPLICVIELNINYQRSRLISKENTLNATSQQFITAKWGCADVLSNTSCGAQKVCGWTVWRTPRFARSNTAKLHKTWEYA